MLQNAKVMPTPVFYLMPEFNSLVRHTLFPMHAQEGFDGVTTQLDGFFLRCEFYNDILVEPKPTDWGWVQFMLSRLTGTARQWPQDL